MTLNDLTSEQFCYLTTTGRVSGRPHTIEIWFGVDGGTLYMLAGARDRSDWVRNLMREPSVGVRIGGSTLTGRARVVEAASLEDALARRLLVEKYRSSRDDLSGWGRTALPVAVDVDASAGGS